MNKTQKGNVVSALKDRLGRATTIYVTDFTGLKVKNVTELRRRFRGLGVEYVVVKNSLALRALKDAEVIGLDTVIDGPTALVLAGADPVGAAKVLADFQKEFERPSVKAGLVEGRVVSAADVKRLAALPSREQLLSQVAGALQAPLSGFLGMLNGLLYQVVGVLEALREQKERQIGAERQNDMTA